MIWTIEDGHALRYGVPNALNHPTCHFLIDNSITLEQCTLQNLSNFFPDVPAENWQFEPLNIPIGSYFPRIARPHHQHAGGFPWPEIPGEFAHERAAASIQVAALSNRLEQCFQIVNPDQSNMAAFGTEFRNILILSATEFEAQCKGILRQNNYNRNQNQKFWNTNDYFKLESAMRLGDYSLKFIRFPWLDPMRPFSNWNSISPTQSLVWYDAYNKTKHDREAHFSLSSLENSIAAVSAVVIICLAQFGITFLREAGLADVFAIETRPFWSIGDTSGAGFDNNIGQTNYPF
jgi:hypothetical protein